MNNNHVSGAISSGFSSAAGALNVGNVAMIGVGGLSGGVGAWATGGNFWDGMRQGLITSTLNHLVHEGAEVVRRRVVKRYLKIAMDKNDSRAYAYATSLDNFPENSNKCNKFVCDVLDEAGVYLIRPNGLHSPPTAGQWADPNYYIPGFEVVPSPQAGDIVAYRHEYSDATGHVAIMTSQYRSIGANATIVRYTDFGSNPSHLPAGSKYVFRRLLTPRTYQNNTNPFRTTTVW